MSYKREFAAPPPADPDVKVPAAIKAAALKADQLHQQFYPTEKQPEVEATEKPVEGQQPPEGTPVPPTPESPPAEPPVAKSGTPEGKDDWEHKYKSLKPRFDQQSDMIAGLNQRINGLERTLANSAKPSPAERRNPDLSFKPLDKEERDAYGDDFLDVAARAAQEKLDPELRRLRDEVEQIKDQTEVQAKQNLYQYLTDNLPSWRQINRNPKFIAWCNLPEPYSGAIRMQMLNDAFARGDAPRVLRFFNGFLTDEAATAPAGNQPEIPTGKPGNGKVPLENFAAPGRAKAPAGEMPPAEKETITQAQIAHFYMLVQKGHYRGNPAEKDRLERMIFEAQAEGRIV